MQQVYLYQANNLINTSTPNSEGVAINLGSIPRAINYLPQNFIGSASLTIFNQSNSLYWTNPILTTHLGINSNIPFFLMSPPYIIPLTQKQVFFTRIKNTFLGKLQPSIQLNTENE